MIGGDEDAIAYGQHLTDDHEGLHPPMNTCVSKAI
jgi:hypothetical protein